MLDKINLTGRFLPFSRCITPEDGVWDWFCSLVKDKVNVNDIKLFRVKSENEMYFMKDNNQRVWFEGVDWISHNHNISVVN